MKRSAIIILAMLSIVCVTIHADEYTWDVAIAPVGTNEYEFSASLKQCAAQEMKGNSGVMHQNENIVFIPPLKVTLDKPADFEMRKPGEEPKIKAKVVMRETPQKVIFTYSAMAVDGKTRHATQGKIEINK